LLRRRECGEPAIFKRDRSEVEATRCAGGAEAWWLVRRISLFTRTMADAPEHGYWPRAALLRRMAARNRGKESRLRSGPLSLW